VATNVVTSLFFRNKMRYKLSATDKRLIEKTTSDFSTKIYGNKALALRSRASKRQSPLNLNGNLYAYKGPSQGSPAFKVNCSGAPSSAGNACSGALPLYMSPISTGTKWNDRDFNGFATGNSYPEPLPLITTEEPIVGGTKSVDGARSSINISYFYDGPSTERGKVLVKKKTDATMQAANEVCCLPERDVKQSYPLKDEIPIGILLTDVVSLDLTKQHTMGDQVQTGSKVSLLTRGSVVLRAVGNPQSCETAYYNKNGNVTNQKVSRPIGYFASEIDDDGYIKVEVKIPVVSTNKYPGRDYDSRNRTVDGMSEKEYLETNLAILDNRRIILDSI